MARQRKYIFEFKNRAKKGSPLYGFTEKDFGGFIESLRKAFAKADMDDEFPYTIEINRGGDRLFFKETGHIEFAIEFSDKGKTVKHELFIIDNENLKNKGLSKALYKSLMPIYDKIGVEEIKIHAGDKNGGYTWSRYGFRVSSSEAQSVIDRISNPEYRKEAQAIYDSFYRKHYEEVKFPMQLLGDKPWGREALSGTKWYGSIDLTDEPQRKRYERYINGEFSQKKKIISDKALRERAHAIRLAQYAGRVQAIYDTLNQEVASAVVRTSYDGEKPFRFSDYPLTKKKIEEVQASFVKDLRSLIYSGTSEEWKQSNLIQDLIADDVMKFYGVKKNGKKHRVYYQHNNDALKSFQRRKDDGLSLSEKLWNQSKGYKQEMEYAISSGIEKGTSAVKLSKRLSKYLQDFPSLKHDYKEKFGTAVTCQDCEYRSIRLARSEINMAYRSAEQERWKQFDFVLGYEIKLTQNGRHKPDICDELAGVYPKDFKFMGWHPNCMCYVVPLLQSEEQFWNEEETEEITETPKAFSDWLEKNAERLDKAAENNTLPYWYEQNGKYVGKRKS